MAYIHYMNDFELHDPHKDIVKCVKEANGSVQLLD